MILLSFDVEEFDMPFEYGKSLDFDEQISISTTGTLIVLDLLKKADVKATFFCTANYAKNKPEIIARIVKEGHEIASHGFYHSDFKPEHLLLSKQVLEEISDTPVKGFRMARMMPVDDLEIQNAGYKYNSSLNPTWIPGRYNNLDKPRSLFWVDEVLQIPSSVSSIIRFPLFWLTFHNLPMTTVRWMCESAHRKDGYLCLYFHPWEFTDLHQHQKYNFPAYVARNSGTAFVKRISRFIRWAKKRDYVFARTGDFAAGIRK